MQRVAGIIDLLISLKSVAS